MHHTHPYIKTYDNYPQITALRTRTIGSFRPSGKAKNKTKKKKGNEETKAERGEQKPDEWGVSAVLESNQTEMWVVCMFCFFPSGPEHSL